MSSELKTNKVSPATGTAFTLGDSGDTFTLPSGGTLDIASGATLDTTGATVSGLTTGALVFLDSSESASDVSSVEFQSFQNTDYEYYKVFARVRMSAYGNDVRLRFMTGATVETASSYSYQYRYWAGSSSYYEASGLANRGYMNACGYLDQDGVASLEFNIHFNHSGSYGSQTNSTVNGSSWFIRYNDTPATGVFGGMRSGSFDGIEIYPSSGNFSNHMIYVYGVKKS